MFEQTHKVHNPNDSPPSEKLLLERWRPASQDNLPESEYWVSTSSCRPLGLNHLQNWSNVSLWHDRCWIYRGWRKHKYIQISTSQLDSSVPFDRYISRNNQLYRQPCYTSTMILYHQFIWGDNSPSPPFGDRKPLVETPSTSGGHRYVWEEKPHGFPLNINPQKPIHWFIDLQICLVMDIDGIFMDGSCGWDLSIFSQ